MPSRSRSVEVVPGRGLDVDGVLVPLVSGAVHYWRCDRDRWDAVLDAVVELGFGVVETYVPWSVHASGRDGYDFSGNRDVVTFLRMAETKGLKAIVRPGPTINAELPDFGFPEQVLWDPDCQARTPWGTPVVLPSRSAAFPVPSYASPQFRAAVDGWYDVVVPLLAALQWPDGPVVACQVDNELGYFFFVDPYVMDYREEFVRRWRTWGGWGDGTTPPVDGDAPEVLRDSWMRWRQHFLVQTLAELGDGLTKRGMDAVPLFHNDFPALMAPLDQAVLEASGAVQVAANDLYVQREDLASAKEVARTLAGSSRLPYIAEMGAGWVADPVGIPQRILPADEEPALLAVLLCGVRAVNFYMLVDREHWYGSPISRTGKLVEADAALYRRMNQVLAELDWWEFERDAPVLLLRDRDLDRRWQSQRWDSATAAVLDPRQFPPELRSALADDVHDQTPLLDRCRSQLEAAGLDFDEGSSDAPPRLDRYALVVTAGDPGGLEHPHVVAASALHTIPLPEPRYRLQAPAGVSLHRFRGPGEREVVGLLNCAATPADVVLSFDGPRTFTGRWRPGTVCGTGVVRMSLPAQQGQLWQVTR